MLLTSEAAVGSRSVGGAVLYILTAAAQTWWVADAIGELGYPWPRLLPILLAASALFVTSAVSGILQMRFRTMLDVTALCLAWGYFGPVLAIMPWRDIAGYVRVRYDLHDQFIAILLLLGATLYTAFSVPLRERLEPAESKVQRNVRRRSMNLLLWVVRASASVLFVFFATVIVIFAAIPWFWSIV
jgi:hypothetical protein